jgi:hypothetical protein
MEILKDRNETSISIGNLVLIDNNGNISKPTNLGIQQYLEKVD